MLFIKFLKVTHNSLNPFAEKYLSVFISAYRKAYSANDVFIGFIRNLETIIREFKYVGIAKPIVYQFTKSFCATLNAREVSFKNCCATNNVGDIFPNKIAQSSAGLT